MDRPIIESLLDVDFYKDLMGQMIFHRHPTVPVKFAFMNRNKSVRLAESIDVGRLRENLEHARTLRFSRAELDFLVDVGMFRPDYIRFLEEFRLPEFHLDTHDGQLLLEFSGEWARVTRWETLAMQLVAELYGGELPREEGVRRLDEKIEIFKANPRIAFSDFGTRRRFSRAWQEEVVGRLRGLPQFRGTSNTLLAMKFGLTPMGTNAHELPMVYSAIHRQSDNAERRMVSSERVLEDWQAEYGLAISIFLPDTYGSDYFFEKVVPREMLEAWKGSRHDSGEPRAYGDARVRMYEAAGIDPRGKLIVFADSLDAGMVDELERYFRGRIQTTFGIGTNLTNDVGLPALSIVVKAVEASGLPVVKLSDNPGKVSGDPLEIERVRGIVAPPISQISRINIGRC